MKSNSTLYVKGLLSLLMVGLFVLIGQAQDQRTYTISGTITDAQTGDPLIGATIQLAGTNAAAITDTEGQYQFAAAVAAGSYTLKSNYVGYRTYTQTLDLANNTNVNITFTMSVDQLNLDEVIVTGSATAVSKRELGNAVTTLGSEDIDRSASVAVDQALSGKISGALVMQNSGDPAGGISIRLRGPSTISGSSDPLYIVDGVIVNNSSNELVDVGGTTQNRLVDINPADIDRIEVIKGAAAAAIYGARASNGVVQIFTKRGAEGKAKITFSTGLKINTLRKQIDYNDAPLAWEDPFDNDNLNTVPATRFNYQDEFFES
ncbi:MAG: carboxypeptidase-like regulatory domain-containing protein, partial [Bacteroidota bacterium]